SGCSPRRPGRPRSTVLCRGRMTIRPATLATGGTERAGPLDKGLGNDAARREMGGAERTDDSIFTGIFVGDDAVGGRRQVAQQTGHLALPAEASTGRRLYPLELLQEVVRQPSQVQSLELR